ncbi:hypothetical protein [Salinispora mooreana]|uniref:hypothetical protein n=1 Tax=Salinispora mooreana TaxID=999545 RepID=UPI00035C9EB8|nr:hypothetical protein [Salinispora mooreana]
MGQQVFEVAVYTVTDARQMLERHGQVHRRLAGYPGYVTSVGLRQVDDPQVFADVVLWQDLASAQAASTAVRSDETLAWFLSSLGEPRLFGHFTMAADPVEPVRQIQAAPVVEIASYQPADDAAHARAHQLLHSVTLPGRHGVHGHVALTGEDGLVGDLIGWESPQVFESTAQALMTDPQLAAFFTPAQRTLVFALFTRTTGPVNE